MTHCAICGAPCAGHADSSNPLCEDCRRLSFGGVQLDPWGDETPPPLTLTPRQLQQIARLVQAGQVRPPEETP